MTAITEKANLEYRDMESPGSSVPNDPDKVGIRELFAVIDIALSSLGVNGAITVKKATLALLDADLAHAADTLAVVYNDSAPAYNGIYAKSGTSGSGSWVLTALAIPSSFAADIAEVMAAIEDVDAAVAASEAAADAADADRIAAEAARVLAEEDAAQAATSRAAADLAAEQAIAAAEAHGDFFAYDTKALADAAVGGLADQAKVRVWVDETQSDHQTIYMKQGGVLVFKADLDLPAARLGVFDSMALAEAQFIPSATDSVKVSGYAVAGDGGEGTYVRVGSEPTLPGKFQSADGAWWDLVAPIVRPAAFGLFTNATATTETLLAAFTAAMAAGRAVELSGAYTINGPITPATAVDGAELHIILRDDVTITVDAGSTAFDKVLFAQSTTAKSHSISGGGTLVINCNSKAAVGVYLRHTAAAKGGTVVLNAPVTVRNIYAVTAYTFAGGIGIFGRYERVVMRSPTVEDVSRQLAGGECSGISITDVDGEVELYSPVTRRILTGAGTADADGIKCFGYQPGVSPNRPRGTVRIYSPIMDDCQGRSYKDQCGDTIVYGPRVKRDASVLVAAANANEFDFQRGNGLVLEPCIEYISDGATAPIPPTHSVCVFQQVLDNAEMFGLIRDATILTDCVIPRYVLHITAASAMASTTEVDGLTILPRGSFATTAFSRTILETDMSQVAACAKETTLRVQNVRGPNTAPLIGYTDVAAIVTGTATAGGATTLTDSGKAWTTNEYAGFELRITSGTGSGQRRSIASNTGTVLTVSTAWATNPDSTSVYGIFRPLDTKLVWDAGEGCFNTLAATVKPFSEISGSVVLAVKQFRNIAAPGYLNAYLNSGFVCNFQNLTVGTVITVDIGTGSFTNPPPWGGSGYAHIRVEGQWIGGNYKTIWVQVGATTYFTEDSGANWV